MNVTIGKYIWHNGEFTKWEDANIHIMSHVIHYGSSVFEGIRAYNTHIGPAIYRLNSHIQRLLDSTKIYRMDVSWTVDTLCKACIDTVKKNEF